MGKRIFLFHEEVLGIIKCSGVKFFFIVIALLFLLNSYGYAHPITLTSNINITNISISNLDSLDITRKVIDYGSTSASAIASDSLANSQTQSEITNLGTVYDVSDSGNAFALASLNYYPLPNSIFAGSIFSLYSVVMLNEYGCAQALSSFSEMIYFTALAPCDITFSLDYSGSDNDLNPGLDSLKLFSCRYKL